MGWKDARSDRTGGRVVRHEMDGTGREIEQEYKGVEWRWNESRFGETG